jgi:hypothetical protein
MHRPIQSHETVPLNWSFSKTCQVQSIVSKVCPSVSLAFLFKVRVKPCLNLVNSFLEDRKKWRRVKGANTTSHCVHLQRFGGRNLHCVHAGGRRHGHTEHRWVLHLYSRSVSCLCMVFYHYFDNLAIINWKHILKYKILACTGTCTENTVIVFGSIFIGFGSGYTA